MATYLQGVTDYIPEYQPFQPDLNFYGNLMQAKQSIYDQNYKALNNVYNQLYSAELTNKENIKNRDELLKQLDFNLNRIAGLDLSLEQNVEQAKQVFKPFYENKSLMRDMAYTKNWNNTYNSAQSLRTSQDKKQRDQYWEEGLRKMQYDREAFANASLENILQMPDSEYTPKVDVIGEYQKLAKEMDLSVDITETNGRYFVRQKNGPLLQAPLTQLFESKLNSDPAIQAFYKTKAHVERLDWAHANADKYGSVELAEKEYLTTNYNLLKEQVKIQNKENQDIKNTLEAKVDNVSTDIKNGKINEHTEEYVQSLEEALGLVTVNADASQNLANELSDKSPSTTVVTSAPDGLDLSNMELARMRVDLGIANSYAVNDINKTAYTLAHKDMIKDMSADPYGVAAQNHAYRASEEAQRAANRRSEIMLRSQLQENLVKFKNALDTKQLIPDGKGGYMQNPAMFQTITEEGDISGGAMDKYPGGIAAFNKDLDKTYTDSFSGMVNKMLFYLKGVQGKDKLSNDQVAAMFLGKSGGQVKLEEKINSIGSGSAATNFLTSLLTGKTKDEVEASGGFLGTLLDIGKETGLSVKDLQPYLTSNIKSDLGTRAKSDKPLFNYSSVEEFTQDFNANPNKFLTNRGGEFLRQMYDNTIKYAQQNQGASFHDEFIKSTAAERAAFNEFTLYLDQKEDTLKSNRDAINTALASSVTLNENPFLKNNRDDILRLAVSEDGMMISKEDFVKLMESRYGKNDVNYETERNYRLSRAYAQAPELFGPEKISKTGDYGNLYDELAGIYKNTVSNGKVMKSYLPLLTENAQSFLANKSNGFTVFLNAPGTPGFGGFLEFVQGDYTNINWTDDVNNKISFFGNTKTGLSSMEDLGYDNQKIRNITSRIIQDLWSKVGDSKAPTFSLLGKQGVLEDYAKGAMILKPSEEILKPYLESKLLSQEAYDAILLNGISFMSNKENFTNSIFKMNQYSPMQAVVNSLKPGETYTYNDPTGKGGYNISKDPYRVSEYNVEAFITDFYTADGRKENMTIPYPPAQIGNNMSQFLLDVTQTISTVAKASTDNFRQFHQSRNTK